MKASLVLLMWLLAATMVQQPAATTPATRGTAEISGAVMTDDTTSVPVRGVTVTLRDGDRLNLIAVTDDNGAFGFTSLPAGRFTLLAVKGGYLPATYGSRRPRGTGAPLVLTAGQRATGIAMKLLKGSVLTGTVVAENGQPVPDVKVAAFIRTVSWQTGERTLEAAPFASSQVTDDRGRYRIWGLEAGEYAVSAIASLRPTQAFVEEPDTRQITEADLRRAQQLMREPVNARTSANASSVAVPPPASPVAFAPVFFPSAVSPADAMLVTLGPREERDGVNIQLRMVPTARVEGVVTGPNGAPIANAPITMLAPGPLPPGMIALSYRNATSDRDGRYVLPGVTPGTYTIVTTTGFGATALGNVTEVVVAGRDIKTPIVLMPGLTISGRMVFEGTSPPPRQLEAVLPRITALLDGPGRFMPIVMPDGTFTVTLMSGKHRVGMLMGGLAPDAGWRLKSVVIDGANVTDVVFDVTKNVEAAVITLTDRSTELSGLLLDATGKVATDYVLLVFSADQRFWLPQSRRTQQARPETNGHFLIRGLPPGDYLICALSDIDPSQSNDPAFLADVASQAPAKITLAEGEKKIQNIRVGGG